MVRNDADGERVFPNADDPTWGSLTMLLGTHEIEAWRADKVQSDIAQLFCRRAQEHLG